MKRALSSDKSRVIHFSEKTLMNDLAYLEHQVLTASPHQLHLMVVEGALRHCRISKEYMLEKNYEQTNISLTNAREFITELLGGLNPEVNIEIVGNLQALFTFAYRNLVQADFDHNPVLINNAIRVLENHRETWIELRGRLGSTADSAAINQIDDDYQPGSFSMDS
jgi:flagellar protein FliS